MQLSIVVPTYNEAPNVPELVRRVALAVRDVEAEIVFVDEFPRTHLGKVDRGKLKSWG